VLEPSEAPDGQVLRVAQGNLSYSHEAAGVYGSRFPGSVQMYFRLDGPTPLPIFRGRASAHCDKRQLGNDAAFLRRCPIVNALLPPPNRLRGTLASSPR